MKVFTYIFVIAIILFGVSFTVLNADPVKLNYYFGVREISLSLLLAFTLIIGAVLGIIVLLSPLFRLKTENYRLRQKLTGIEQEVENLRSIPIKDTH